MGAGMADVESDNSRTTVTPVGTGEGKKRDRAAGVYLGGVHQADGADVTEGAANLSNHVHVAVHVAVDVIETRDGGRARELERPRGPDRLTIGHKFANNFRKLVN